MAPTLRRALLVASALVCPDFVGAMQVFRDEHELDKIDIDDEDVDADDIDDTDDMGDQYNATQPPPELKVSAVVLNLDRRPDRLQAFSNRLDYVAPWLKWEKLSAVDGKAEPPPESDVTIHWNNSVISKVAPNQPQAYKEHTFSVGERGCAASHLKAWRYAATLDHPLIIFEDDVVIAHYKGGGHNPRHGMRGKRSPTFDFTNGITLALNNVPKDADLLNLFGIERGKFPGEEIGNDYLVKVGCMYTTVAYVVWPEGAKKLIAKTPIDMAVDDFMCVRAHEGDINGYRPKGHWSMVYHKPAKNGDIDYSYFDGR